MSLELKWWQCFQSKLACRVPLFEFDTVKEVHYLKLDKVGFPTFWVPNPLSK